MQAVCTGLDVDERGPNVLNRPILVLIHAVRLAAYAWGPSQEAKHINVDHNWVPKVETINGYKKKVALADAN